ncbi:BgtAc-30095 [Blumeria graminis f. sp. tritici]|uniref:BgtAc-30095 n=2 Tax=Blumeria graminis f. sp. tritici TaxID=62690 RepID=A0A9X9MK15_BLUGR|nr:hypothetical protein BGT96224_Ac30095 [Blumeria graminis f. sp. tritici 96224]VDB90401.1 BgtAc-30095 [Blumeria graminis f. sp. tritici]
MTRTENKIDALKLHNLFSTASVNIVNDEIDLEELQPVARAISQELDAIDIVNVAIKFAQNLSRMSSLIQKIGQYTSFYSFSRGTFQWNIAIVLSIKTSAPAVADVLKNEVDGNGIMGLSKFWEVFFLDKEWSDQTLHIWEFYQSYEADEVKIQEEDD